MASVMMSSAFTAQPRVQDHGAHLALCLAPLFSPTLLALAPQQLLVRQLPHPWGHVLHDTFILIPPVRYHRRGSPPRWFLWRWLLFETQREQVPADVRGDRLAVAVELRHGLGALLGVGILLADLDDALVSFVEQVQVAAHHLDQDLLRRGDMLDAAEVGDQSRLHCYRVLT